MADISEDIMSDLRQAFQAQRYTSLTGTYDGVTAQMSITFFEGDTEVESFTYEGVEFVEFKEKCYQATGRCVQRHNATYYQVDRTDFIERVTE